MSTLKKPKPPGHSKHNDFLFKEIEEGIYEGLTILAGTLVQFKVIFEAVREKAKEIINTVNERNKTKISGEPLEKPTSAIPEVQFMFEMNDSEYDALQKAVVQGNHTQDKCDFLTFCCNIGLLPFEKDRKKPTTSGITDEFLLEKLHPGDYNLFSALVEVELENPAIAYENVKDSVHKAIRTSKTKDNPPRLKSGLI